MGHNINKRNPTKKEYFEAVKKKMIRGIRFVLMLAALVWVSNAKSHKRAMDSGTGIVGIDKRYKIVSETVHWTDAIARCKKIGDDIGNSDNKGRNGFPRQTYWQRQQ